MKWVILGKFPKIPSEKSTIKLRNLKRVVDRIKLSIKKQEPVIVYGDYDADGICATAIVWETLHSLGAKVMPFIPAREKEGYGLSVEGIKNIANCSLLIVVDSGIVADEAVDFANSQNMDVIILDHHEKPKKLPKAFAIIHTEKLCASGIAYFLAKEFNKNYVDLAAIATVTDLMPLTGVNRKIVKEGLEILNKTSRVGLKALFETAGIKKVGTYEIGYLIGPRLNASGRMESALTALRLLCTKNPQKAKELAELLNKTNKERQVLVEEQSSHALKNVSPEGKIIVLEHESYHQGIIGLIAGKLTEKYYLPAIVISKGETVSKASARSISGFNIIEAIRSCENLLLNAGGHPMAAGFTIETAQISNFKFQISNYANKNITDNLLEKTLKIDCELKIEEINMKLYEKIQELAPFGMGNPEPVFASVVTVKNIRTVGTESKHLKLVIASEAKQSSFDAIGFNLGSLAAKLKIGDKISVAYNLDLNIFNGRENLQLKLKDVRLG